MSMANHKEIRLTIRPLGSRAIGDGDGDEEETETKNTHYQTDSIELPEKTECLGLKRSLVGFASSSDFGSHDTTRSSAFVQDKDDGNGQDRSHDGNCTSATFKGVTRIAYTLRNPISINPNSSTKSCRR